MENYQVIMAQPFAQKRAGQIHPNGGSRGPQTIENWVHLTSGKEVLKIACLEDVSYVFFHLTNNPHIIPSPLYLSVQ